MTGEFKNLEHEPQILWGYILKLVQLLANVTPTRTKKQGTGLLMKNQNE